MQVEKHMAHTLETIDARAFALLNTTLQRVCERTFWVFSDSYKISVLF